MSQPQALGFLTNICVKFFNHLKGKENVITFAKHVRILRVMACWKAL
jgi:hypothetical protein